jgi:hypothetical protein
MIDAAMPFLDCALNCDEAAAALGRLRLAGSKITVETARLIQHKPARRAVIEYQVRIESLAGGSEIRTLVGKARAKGLDRKSFELTRQLAAEFEATEPDTVHIPRPFGVLPEFNMWLQEKVPGTRLTEFLLAGDARTLGTRVARALHKIHCSRVAAPSEHTLNDELKILDRRLKDVSAAKPELAARIDALLARCHELVRSIPTPRPSPIHRDFHPGQVLVDGPRLWLLDFDLFSTGDPAVDVGNFIAHITELSVRHFGDDRHLATVEQAVEDEYIALTDETIRCPVHAYVLLSLARHIFISTQFEDRRAFTEPLLRLCEERFGCDANKL